MALAEVQRLPTMTARLQNRVDQRTESPWNRDDMITVDEIGVWLDRINLDYRAMARRRNDLIVWFWIGDHARN
jgi:hypothetical protein